jgi:hypothetical protein
VNWGEMAKSCWNHYIVVEIPNNQFLKFPCICEPWCWNI